LIEVMVPHRSMVLVDDAAGNGTHVSRGDRGVEVLVCRRRGTELAEAVGDDGIAPTRALRRGKLGVHARSGGDERRSERDSSKSMWHVSSIGSRSPNPVSHHANTACDICGCHGRSDRARTTRGTPKLNGAKRHLLFAHAWRVGNDDEPTAQTLVGS